MNGKVLGAGSLAQMTATVRIAPKAGYGLGLLKLDLPCGVFWGHDGGLFGYTSNVFVSRDGDHVAVVLANRGSLGARQHRLFDRLVAEAACESLR